MDEVIETLGATSLLGIAIAFLSGLFMRYKRKPLLKIHKITGYAALAVAIGHGMLSMLD
jgi:hypothetical protein